MPNVKLRRYSRPSMWRRLSLANWRDARDPQVYGRQEVDMSQAIAFAEKESLRTGEKVTPTHIVIRALAVGLHHCPEANVLIRWNRIYLRQDVDIFCQVAIPGEKPDLSGTTIRQADRKGAPEIAAELRFRAEKVRAGTDRELAPTRSLLHRFPVTLVRFMLWLVGVLSYTLNLNLRGLGLPRDPFGGAMLTSIGSLGISEGFAPLVPMSRVPLLVAVGKVEDRPVVREGQVVIRPLCTLTTTFDHRLMDGFTAGKMARVIIGYLEAPERWEQKMASGPTTTEDATS